MFEIDISKCQEKVMYDREKMISEMIAMIQSIFKHYTDTDPKNNLSLNRVKKALEEELT